MAKFEDFKVGTKFTHPTYRTGTYEVIEFGRRYNGTPDITAIRNGNPVDKHTNLSHFDAMVIIPQKPARNLTHVTKAQLQKELEEANTNTVPKASYEAEVAAHDRTKAALKQYADEAPQQQHKLETARVTATKSKELEEYAYKKLAEAQAELTRVKNLPIYKLNMDLGLKVKQLQEELASQRKFTDTHYYSESKKQWILIEALDSNHLRNALKKAKLATGSYPKALKAEWDRRGLGLE